MLQPPLIFPTPQHLETRGAGLAVGEDLRILLPPQPDDRDLALARLLAADLVDRYQVAVPVAAAVDLPAEGPYLLMGGVDNPLVQQAVADRGLDLDCARGGQEPARGEGYVLDVDGRGAVVAGTGPAGASYGLQTLRQLLAGRPPGDLALPGLRVCDFPRLPLRGLRLFLPGREHFAFFKRFVGDVAAQLKYNTLILEVNAAMRLHRHPELNAGWHEFGRCLNESRRSRPEGPGRQFQDSAHHDTGDFSVVEQQEVADLVAYTRRHHIDVIPEIPSLTHAYYLLTRHRDLAEIRRAEWPDTWCPLEPEAYELYFDVLDEYLDVMQPRTVHIGHDEWRMPMGACPKCRDRDYHDLLLEDITRIHAHLADRGVRTAMWGDHLLEGVRGAGGRDTVSKSGYHYRMPGALRPEQVAESLPKDILVLNWFWNTDKRPAADADGAQLAAWGFDQAYGNLTPAIAAQEYGRRTDRRGVLGGAPSAWTQTSEAVFGKDNLYDFVGCAGLLWSSQWHGEDELTPLIQSLMPRIRRSLHGAPTPLEIGASPCGVDLGPARNSPTVTGPGGDSPPALRCAGQIGAGPYRFDLPEVSPEAAGVRVVSRGPDGPDGPWASASIPVGADASSLLFLHACQAPAGNAQGHFQIYNVADTADLLGWYEVQYEDDFTCAVPIRYGVNILEWTWGRQRAPGALCYAADPVDCAAPGGAPATAFAHEWVNPRYGKAIRSVRLCGSRGFVDGHGRPMAGNAVVLLALSLTEPRPGPAAEYVAEDA